MYIRDNKETETEFREMRESNDKLQKELQHEKSERQILSTTNLDMRTQIESLNLKLTSLETTMKNLETQVKGFGKSIWLCCRKQVQIGRML